MTLTGDQRKQGLSSSTFHGLRVTLTSTMQLSTYLMETDGFHYMLTSRFGQDPLEVCITSSVGCYFKRHLHVMQMYYVQNGK